MSRIAASRRSAGIGWPARPSTPFTAFSSSQRSIDSPLTFASTSGSVAGSGLTTGGCVASAGAAEAAGGVAAVLAGGVVWAGLRQATASDTRNRTASVRFMRVSLSRWF
jgi:hypothetical protein